MKLFCNTLNRTRILIVSLLFTSIITLYLVLGEYAELIRYQQQQPLRQLVQEIKKNPIALAKLTQQLQQRINDRGGDAKGWYLLARLYLHQQRYREASHAFAKAYELEPQEKALLSWQLESLYFSSNEQVTNEVKSLMAKVQRIDPQSVVLQQLMH